MPFGGQKIDKTRTVSHNMVLKPHSPKERADGSTRDSNLRLTKKVVIQGEPSHLRSLKRAAKSGTRSTEVLPIIMSLT